MGGDEIDHTLLLEFTFFLITVGQAELYRAHLKHKIKMSSVIFINFSWFKLYICWKEKWEKKYPYKKNTSFILNMTRLITPSLVSWNLKRDEDSWVIKTEFYPGFPFKYTFSKW